MVEKKLPASLSCSATTLSIGLPGHRHREGLGLQTPALAVGAIHRRHEALDLFADVVVVRFLVAARQHRHDTFVRSVVRVRAFRAAELELDLLVRAVKDDVARLLRQRLPRHVELELVVLCQRVNLAKAPVLGPFLPDGDRSVFDRLRRVGDDLLLVDLQQHAEARAARAGTVRGVEGEKARRDLADGNAAVGAGETLRQELFAASRVRRVIVKNLHQALRDARGCLERVGQTLLDAILDDKPVDDDIDGVLLLLVEHRRIGQLDHRAVDDGAREAFLHHLQHLLAVFAFLAADVRSEDGELRAGLQRHEAIDHLLNGLRPDLLAAARAVRHADGGVEQSQVVVNLGDGADGRARIARRRALLDGNGRREPFDRIDVRLLHLLEELPRVGAERFDVPPLPLGKNRVEGQR